MNTFLIVKTDSNGDVVWHNAKTYDYNTAKRYAEVLTAIFESNYWVIDLSEAVLKCSV